MLSELLKKKGRFGDTELVHMSKQELDDLENMARLKGTHLTKNPDTGLPEAWGLGNITHSVTNAINPTKWSIGGSKVLSPVGLRNIQEAGLVDLGNYLLPGSSLLTNNLISKGAQQGQSSPLGLVGQIGSSALGLGVGSGTTGVPSTAGGNWEAGLAGYGPTSNSALSTDPVLGGSAGGPLLNGGTGTAQWAPLTGAGANGLSAAGSAEAGITGGLSSNWPYAVLGTSILGDLYNRNLVNQQLQMEKQNNEANRAMGAPYRQQLSDLIANPDAYLNSQEVQIPVQQGTNAMARSLSVNGNPIGSGNALQGIQDYSANSLYANLANKENQLAKMGGLPDFNAQAPLIPTNANLVNANNNVFTNLGYNLNNIYNPYSAMNFNPYAMNVPRLSTSYQGVR